ncbi:MAG: thiamine pyrophosphate-dependent enzyme, partial [Thermanaerothrix sp.]|nr:thiamine pyrophosphate-dependent enzyme [Thermanaerothrix sp.]
MSVTKAFNIERISQRACAYGIPGVTVDGNDVLAVYAAVRQAAERARAGQGPTLVEAVTYRWRGHSKSDRQAYRTREEVKLWQQRDPIRRFANLLGLSEEELNRYTEDAKARIEAAVAFAQASPEPDVSTILEGVYA